MLQEPQVVSKGFSPFVSLGLSLFEGFLLVRLSFKLCTEAL